MVFVQHVAASRGGEGARLYINIHLFCDKVSVNSEPALIHKHSNEENPADNQLVTCQ